MFSKSRWIEPHAPLKVGRAEMIAPVEINVSYISVNSILLKLRET
jgi:hypothetical protein